MINQNSENCTEKNNLNISTIYDTLIEINDLPGSLTNWSWAKDQGYCTGFGTSNNPYIISNHIFNTSGLSGSPLMIYHSRKHFTIENCLFIGHPSYGGIFMRNVSNGEITGNSMAGNTGALLYMQNSSYNIISNNIASNGDAYGILLEGLTGPTRYNTISNNLVLNNSNTGISLRDGCENNTISGNIVSDNGNYGIDLDSGTEDNEIYLNCFNNTSNAIDDGTNNRWDNGIKGNYWEDYLGVDMDDDGIGDSPYSIPGSAGSQDNDPLMKCPEERSSDKGIPGFNVGILLSSLFVLVFGATYWILRKKRIEPAIT
jgi:parallel beta-helix repeat protein